MRVKVWNDHGNPVKLLHSGIHTVDGPDVLGRHRFPATGGIHGAVLQKQETVAEPQGQVQVVDNNQHGDMVAVGAVADELHGLVLVAGVQAACGLVQQHQLRLLGDGPGQHHLLLFAAGEVVAVFVKFLRYLRVHYVRIGLLSDYPV